MSTGNEKEEKEIKKVARQKEKHNTAAV